jgi:hypothetical protein
MSNLLEALLRLPNSEGPAISSESPLIPADAPNVSRSSADVTAEAVTSETSSPES